MLTPLQFKEIFDKNRDRFKTWSTDSDMSRDTARLVYNDIDENSSLTKDQWANLVKVCSMIKAAEWRFNMQLWHNSGAVNPVTHECGTTHCIAGWAMALEANDIDTEKFLGLDRVAEFISPYLRPFFWLTSTPEESGETAEDVIMEILIDPILEEAKKESFELSDEFQKVLNKISQPIHA